MALIPLTASVYEHLTGPRPEQLVDGDGRERRVQGFFELSVDLARLAAHCSKLACPRTFSMSSTRLDHAGDPLANSAKQ